MRYRVFALLAFLLSIAPAASAQEALLQNTDEGKPTLQQRLVPQSAASLLAPVQLEEKKDGQPTVANMAAGSGTGLMIAGAALFVAGLIIGNEAGTVLAVAGAAVGAYGLYVYFQ
jgi:hypothetical protein